jgi:hypothetical protein
MAIIGIVDNAAAVLEACLDDRIHDWFEPGPGETVETVLAGIRGRLSHVEPTADIDGPSLLRVVLAVQALDLAHRVTPVPVGYP